MADPEELLPNLYFSGELFLEFPVQRAAKGLSLFSLSAREFPETGQRALRRSLLD
jgi:hypothetical protein